MNGKKLLSGLSLGLFTLTAIATVAPTSLVEVQAASCIDGDITITAINGVTSLDLEAAGLVTFDSAINRTYTEVSQAPNIIPVVANATPGVIDITTVLASSGTETITYSVSDDFSASGNCIVNITVQPNNPPVANPQTITDFEDGPVMGQLTADDEDQPTLTNWVEVGGPTPGLTIDPLTGEFTHIPPEDFIGTLDFQFTVEDNAGQVSLPATITIDLAEDTAPTDPVVEMTDEDMPIDIDLLATVSDFTPTIETTPITVTAVDAVSVEGGTIVFLSGSTYTYTPPVNFAGTDSFTYTIDDGSGPIVVTVNITVNDLNDLPVANDDFYSTDEDVTLDIPAPGVLVNDTDIDLGNILSVNVTNFTQPANGTVTMNADGSFTYMPNPNFFGIDSFQYYVNDGTADSAMPATVTIEVFGILDFPTIVFDDIVIRSNVAEGGTITLSGTVSDPDNYLVNPFVEVEPYLGAAPILAVLNGPDSMGMYTFSAEYVYVDDNPTATEADDEIISAYLRDDSGLLNSTISEIFVLNVAPSVTNLTSSSTTFMAGGMFTMEAMFTDPGVMDDKAVTVDWGYGTDPVVYSFTGDGMTTDYSTGSLSYMYANPGEYTIVVSFQDDDNGLTVERIRINVTSQDEPPMETPGTTDPLAETGTSVNSTFVLGSAITSLLGIAVTALKKYFIKA